MLPGVLRSSYKEYKADSDAVANWLARTARDCGYSVDELAEGANSAAKPTKLKGRARKLARDAAAADSANGSQHSKIQQNGKSRPRYLIPVSGFVKLAKFIASIKPKITVPHTFRTALRKAIEGRKRHKVFHSENDNSDNRNSVDGHSHFIEILESVWTILEPLSDGESVQPQFGPSATHETPAEIFGNSFQKLKVDDTSENIRESVSNHEKEKPSHGDTVEFGVKPDATSELEEAFFAFQCMLHDYGNLRRYLQSVWSGYRDGVFDLTAASVVSNTAIDFARGIEEEFTLSFPQIDVEKFMDANYLHHCLQAGVLPNDKQRISDDMNFAVYEATEPSFYPVYSLLVAFSKVLQPKQLPAMKPGFYGIYDASSDRTSKSAREKFLEDKIVLLEALPEFTIIAMSSDRIWAEDEITRGMRELIKTKKIRVWLSLACQIFLDIHHILREEVFRGMYDLNRSATYVKATIKSALSFHENLRVDNWPKSNDKVLAEILSYIKDWVEIDMVEILRSRMLKSSAFQPPRPSPFFLLKQHPLLCGLMTFSIRLRSQDAGISFANAWGSVLYSAHLYNAVRQEKLLNDAWKDINLALLSHDTEAMFIGAFPKTTEDYFKRWALAMGVSASAFAKDNRPSNNGKLKESKKGPRSLNELCPVSRMFRQRYCEQSGLLSLSPDDLERILSEHADDEDPADFVEDEDGWVTPSIKINIRAGKQDGQAEENTNASLKKKGGVYPIQLLNSLLNALVSEVFELSFSHFRLHMFCWRLLRSVNTAVEADLKKIYGPDYIEHESQLPHVVGMIFMAAVKTQKIGKLFKAKKQDVVTNELLIKAAGAFQTMIDTGAGEIECKMLVKGLGYEADMPDVVGESMDHA